MKADLTPLIDEIANRADDFLTDVRSRAEARSGINELLASDYPALPADQKAAVLEGVMQVLEREDFFGIEFVGDPFAQSESSEAE